MAPAVAKIILFFFALALVMLVVCGSAAYLAEKGMREKREKAARHKRTLEQMQKLCRRGKIR